MTREELARLGVTLRAADPSRPPPGPLPPPPRATGKDAPVPEEHVESRESSAVFHPVWIPRTSTLCYLTGQHALNLKGPGIGGPGDWHRACWWCPVDNVPWGCHHAITSDTVTYRDRTRVLALWLGDEELADARPALARIGHPAGTRDELVHCASHIRAIIELAWGRLDRASGDPELLLSVVDPWTVSKWIRASAHWERLHALARRVRDELVDSAEARKAWEHWRRHQCPEGCFTRPDATWPGE